MSDFFQTKKKNISKKINNNRIIENPVLFSNSDNPEITFIIDKLIGKNLLTKFKEQFIDSIDRNLKYQILYCFKYKPLESDLKSNIHLFYNDNKIDLQSYIKPWSKIITLGRTIYQMIEGNADLNVEAFYDFIFNKTYFFTPSLKSWVFPIDYFFDIIDKDHFKSFFASRQIKECLEFKNNPLRIPKLECILVERPNEFLMDHMDACEVAIDTETSGFNFLENEIGCVTLSFDGKIGYYLRWKDVDKELFNKFLKNKYQIFANGKFDIKFFWKYSCTNAKVDYDTLHAGHILNEMRSNSLKAHSYLYSYYGGYDRELDEYKRKYPKLKNYLEIPEPILFKYATMDAIVTFQVFKEMKKQMELIDNTFYDIDCKWKLSNYYFKVNIPVVNTFAEIEYNGIYYDWNRLEELSERLNKEIIEKKKEIYKALDIDESLIDLDNLSLSVFEEFEKKYVDDFFIQKNKQKKMNVDSNEQLGEILEKKGWIEIERSKKGNYLVNDDTLNKWLKMGYTESQLILDLHSLNTMMKTFVGNKDQGNGFWQYRNIDDKLHPNVGVMLTNSGRNWMKNPNLQNQKQRGYMAKELRSVFITPNKDYYLADVDMKSFQLFIGCILSGDKEMEKAFKEFGGDLHSLTATSVFCRDMSLEDFLKNKDFEPFKTYRYKSKAVNFSLEFGSSAFSFAKQSIEPDWTIEEAKDYVFQNGLTKKVDFFLNMLYGKSNFNINEEKEDENEEETTSMYASIDNKENFAYFWTVASDIRKKFFEKYWGLKLWIDKCVEEGKNQGYIISPFGAIRRLPELLYKGKDTKSSHYKNLCNISINSRVQSTEASVIAISIYTIAKKLKENKLKSRIFNMVHDSIDLYIHKNEKDITKKIIKETMEEYREIYKDIPIGSEGALSYPYAEFGSEFYYKDEKESDPKKQIKDHRYWGFGKHWF